MNTNEAVLISYITKLIGEALAAHEIERLSALVNEITKPNGVNIGAEKEINYLLASMKDGRKIDAIKAYRTLCGQGLRESKDAVEKYWTAPVALAS